MITLDLPQPIRRHLLTVEQYHRMGEVGVLAPDAHVELIEGEVIDMAPIGTRHSGTVRRLTHGLVNAVGTRAIVSTQNPLRLGASSEPQPDLVLLKPHPDFYTSVAPTAADVLLLIEVADSSSAYDRDIKAPLYARHGIVEYWIIDLDAKLVQLHRRPKEGAYLDVSTGATPGPTPVAALPDLTIDLSGIFG